MIEASKPNKEPKTNHHKVLEVAAAISRVCSAVKAGIFGSISTLLEQKN
jgi:hypothetical protein